MSGMKATHAISPEVTYGGEKTPGARASPSELMPSRGAGAPVRHLPTALPSASCPRRRLLIRAAGRL